MTSDPAELQRRARKLLPRNVYDYYAGGSGRERTLRANEKAWREVWIAPRVLRDVSSVNTATRMLGTEFATPLCVAPTGFHGLAHPDGELATAAGAAAAGDGGRSLLAGLTGDLSHATALAGAASVAEAAGIARPAGPAAAATGRCGGTPVR